MLDRIHMFIPFRKESIQMIGRDDRPTLIVDLESLGVRMRAAGGVTRRDDGGFDCEDLSHAWEKLPSSYTPMAFKVFHQSLGKRLDPGVELKASPAKLLQGHNVFGPTSIRMGAEVMLKWLAGSYPELWAQLDWLQAEAYAIDCTYSARMPNEKTSLQVIQFLRGVSNGQTRNRGDDYQTTAYWGSKETRLRKLKAYLKGPEFRNEIERVLKDARGALADPERRQDLDNAHVREWKVLKRESRCGMPQVSAARTLKVLKDPRLLAFADNLLRLEATVMHRWLERREIPTNLWALCDYQEALEAEGRCFIQECWSAVTSELFAALEGMTMRVINDDKVLAALIEKYTKVGKGKWTKARADKATGAIIPAVFVPGKSSDAYARNLFRTYRSIKDYGWEETMASMSRATFYDHVRDICEIGISKAALQKLKANDATNNVIPVLRLLQVEFSAQRPDWYVEPTVEAA
ncbi:phage/plasmid replication protein, II/X family [Pseudomonas aeruginosa]|uniref:phage/plasmid replication protein, II/X family n=1 Tax=Pseudomonas aeruginosa TaxID=287 RepID=UPI001E5F1271|nr:phage/plasmid replication protein, II/X family [Pseudomonas aeruginosa]MCO2924039.1 replication initiation protein [Pseudomonas aeruginosa]MDI3896224.1 phage/plasmid replication protein, II/X family [Pseudomonas aeruginosa]UFM92447.1 phage/plasmid replication protein, II/X family [Pseudomonas aeruginosa]UFM92457.1 phage/plasmid replication protein, II/X family [Pseudomonas aeruginosa]UFN01043.1 phage/plasmid replication protein, II/X family [Pseudomonas aeruginosa]